jgi:hypothetical protein
MRSHHYRLACLSAIQARENVMHRRAIALFVAREPLLHGGLVTGFGELLHYPAPHCVVLGTSGGMRNAIPNKTVQDFAGALRRELGGAGVYRLRRRGAQSFD